MADGAGFTRAGHLEPVPLPGGDLFQNACLSREVHARLRRLGFSVLRPHRVPPSDGGLALGQTLIAATRLGATPPAVAASGA